MSKCSLNFKHSVQGIYILMQLIGFFSTLFIKWKSLYIWILKLYVKDNLWKIYINTCITMNFCILFVIFHKLSKYGKFYYILIEQQWKCSCSNNKVYTNTVLIQNIYTHIFSRSRYMYGIYSEESRQKSERENLAHLRNN